jgi:hypothetical protein
MAAAVERTARMNASRRTRTPDDWKLKKQSQPGTRRYG